MTPEQYLQQLEQYADDADIAAVLSFSERYGAVVDNALSPTQRQIESDIVHWAAMLDGMRSTTPSEEATRSAS